MNNCRYDDFDVPDTMNVHGIYDTSATMHTFESRAEFQQYLQKEAGVSGSYFGFYAGAKRRGEAQPRLLDSSLCLFWILM